MRQIETSRTIVFDAPRRAPLMRVYLDVDLLITYDDRMIAAGEVNGFRCTAPS